MIDEATIIEALRGARPLPELAAALGMDEAGIAAAIEAWIIGRAAPRSRSVKAPVTAAVDIVRDGAGIPHVYASHTTDLYFGLGLAMAEDRLWQMDRLRRRALGRQAEILGPAFVAADLAHLTVGIDQIAAREVPSIRKVQRFPVANTWR